MKPYKDNFPADIRVAQAKQRIKKSVEASRKHNHVIAAHHALVALRCLELIDGDRSVTKELFPEYEKVER